MMQFATEYQDFEIVATLMRQLPWSHFTLLIPIREPLKRSFYEQMAITEHWSVRTLREKISSQLFERTAISRQPEETIKHDLALLREENKMTPNLVFRDPYLLHLFGLKDTYSEKDLKVPLSQKCSDSLRNWVLILLSSHDKNVLLLTMRITI